MSSVTFFKVLAKILDVLAGPSVTLGYPLYASIRAMESQSLAYQQQWLTYWVLYSFITFFELTFARILQWFPFWSNTKLIFICWLVLPCFNGATYVYQTYIRPTIQRSVITHA